MHRLPRTLGVALSALATVAFTATSCADLATTSSPVALTALEQPVMASSHLPSVRVSEFHYDNSSTDANERIEISGPAGTSLSGWSIVLVNGSNGAVYDTDALSGTIPASCGDRGVVVMTYPVNGIQNGSPDGIALVNNGAVMLWLGDGNGFAMQSSGQHNPGYGVLQP